MPTRRHFLLRSTGFAAAGLAAVAVPEAATATPGTRPRPRRGAPTFVLVPGSHGNGQYLEPLSSELTARGHRVVTFEPPGHGREADFPVWYQAPQNIDAMTTAASTISDVTLAQTTSRLVELVRRVAANGPVVLVGHSLGGAVIGTVTDAVPHLIDHVVYVSAYCMVTLPNVAQYVSAPENAGSALSDPSLIAAPPTVGALRVNWRSADPVFQAKLRAAYLPEATPAQFRTLTAGLQPDESLRLSYDDARVHARRWGRVPRSYVRLVNDRATPVALQDRMIREADALTPHNRFHVHSLATSHLGFYVAPLPLADVLTGLAP